jgi:hypothetical protein
MHWLEHDNTQLLLGDVCALLLLPLRFTHLIAGVLHCQSQGYLIQYLVPSVLCFIYRFIILYYIIAVAVVVIVTFFVVV